VTVIVGLRLVFVALVILSNALQWRFQLHALSASDATFPVTIATLASNVVVASLAGFLLFGEVITSTWMLGALLIMGGLVLVHFGQIHATKKRA